MVLCSNLKKLSTTKFDQRTFQILVPSKPTSQSRLGQWIESLFLFFLVLPGQYLGYTSPNREIFVEIDYLSQDTHTRNTIRDTNLSRVSFLLRNKEITERNKILVAHQADSLMREICFNSYISSAVIYRLSNSLRLKEFPE